MHDEDYGSIIRTVLTALGGSLVADGIITSGQLTDAVGAIVVLAGLAWSLWQKEQSRKQLAVAANTGSVAIAKSTNTNI